jgi:adenylosuccinate synthase
VVLNPASLLDEIRGLTSRGIKVADNLLLSDRAHVIFPWHFEEDRLLDQCSTGESIGTTMRGIGPCYRDKVGRSWAIRLGDMYHDGFRQRVEQIARSKTRMLAGLGDAKSQDVRFEAAEIFEQYADYARQLRPHVIDTTAFLLDAVESGKRLLFEGAQGSLLDIDHGTFPFVTSSNSSGVGVASGSGVPGRHISKVVGVLKAYTTRVGGGPFPTEQDNEIGNHIRERGNEYGTVTKRPRRCGWFDAVAARYAARLGGVDVLAVMLLDVLGALDELKICVAYDIDGARVTNFPSHVDDLRRAVPIYETLPGWRMEIDHLRRVEQLPAAACAYLARISELVGCPVETISVGPDREQTISAATAR